jgi:hypothetical protein
LSSYYVDGLLIYISSNSHTHSVALSRTSGVLPHIVLPGPSHHALTGTLRLYTCKYDERALQTRDQSKGTSLHPYHCFSALQGVICIPSPDSKISKIMKIIKIIFQQLIPKTVGPKLLVASSAYEISIFFIMSELNWGWSRTFGEIPLRVVLSSKTEQR